MKRATSTRIPPSSQSSRREGGDHSRREAEYYFDSLIKSRRWKERRRSPLGYRLSVARAPRNDSAELKRLVEASSSRIHAAASRADLVSNHQGFSGARREQGIRTFLQELLPSRYHVGTGLAFDSAGGQSRQLDVIVSLDSPFLAESEVGADEFVPCEAVLAVVEVKTTLSREELRKAIMNAISVRALKPYGKASFVDARSGGAELARHEHRVLYSLVAYDTDLVKGANWLETEWDRLESVCKEVGVAPSMVDRLVVLSRGVIDGAHGVGRVEPEGLRHVATHWFVHIFNHIERESRRRPPFDLDVYTARQGWTRLGSNPKQHESAAGAQPSASERANNRGTAKSAPSPTRSKRAAKSTRRRKRHD